MNMKKKDPESTEMTFFEHIDALRPHLVRGVMAIGVIGLVAFFCKSFIIDTVLFGPQSPDFPTNRMLTWVGAQWAHMAEWLNSVLGTSFDTDPETFRIANDRFSIINTSLSGQFNLHMKISLLTGLAMAMPYTLWEFWRFVRPALTPKEIQGTTCSYSGCRSVSSEGCCSVISSWRRCRSTSSPTTRPASSSPTCSTSATT